MLRGDVEERLLQRCWGRDVERWFQGTVQTCWGRDVERWFQGTFQTCWGRDVERLDVKEGFKGGEGDVEIWCWGNVQTWWGRDVGRCEERVLGCWGTSRDVSWRKDVERCWGMLRKNGECWGMLKLETHGNHGNLQSPTTYFQQLNSQAATTPLDNPRTSTPIMKTCNRLQLL